jgi:quinoprotein glucose dehydrogenase
VLWSQRLPEGGQATPITYRAPRSGRQMVVIVSGSRVDLLGNISLPMHVMAYALPN